MKDQQTYFLNAAGRYPLLSGELEIRLARDVQAWLNHPDYPEGPKQIKRRGMRARDRLVQSNMRLVAHVARGFERRIISGGYEFTDLLQDGCVGLLRAVEKFDPERGYKFSTYAYWWIKQAINRGIETRQRPIRIPSNLMSAIGKTNKVVRELSLKLGRMPTQKELAEGLGLDPTEFYRYQLLQARQLQLDQTGPGGEDRSLAEMVADPNSADDEEVTESLQMSQWNDQLKVAWNCLRDDEQELLSMRYGLNGYPAMAYAELSAQTGLTRERMRQRVVAIQHKLRMYCQSQRVAVALSA